MAKHPALFFVLAFGGGIICQHFAQLPFFFSAAVFIPTTLFALILYPRAKTSALKTIVDTMLLLAIGSAGMLRTFFAQDIPAYEISRRADHNAEDLLLGKVLDMPEQRRDYWRVPIAVQALQRAGSTIANLQGTVLASGKQLQSLAAGEEVILRGRLRLADEARNPGAFDYRAYLRAHEICALFYCSDSTPVWTRPATTRWSLPRLSASARVWLETQLAQFSSGQARALINGLLLGNVEEIDPEVIESFARTGLIHILSVSGLHVGFIALILIVAAGLTRIPKRWQWPVVIIALWFYAHLTGMKPPIVRATLMATALLLGRVFERETNLSNNLGLAATLILIWQPLQLFQLGFQLSFMAMFGLAYLHKPLSLVFIRAFSWRFRLFRWAITLAAATLAAQLATLPMVVSTYGRIPFAALWGNIIVIPISFVTVATASLACVCAPFSKFLLHVYGSVADLTATLMLTFTQWLSTLPLAYLAGIHFTPLFIAFYLLTLATMVAWRKRARRWLLPLALVALNLHVWNEAWRATSQLRITFFDVGQGDAALLEFPNGRRLLIDTGPQFRETNAGERIIVPYLYRQGIRQLQAVIISHPHADHLGGLPAVLSALKIDTVYHSGVNLNSELEQRCRHLIDSLRVPSKTLQAGARVQGFEPAAITILCSQADGRQQNAYDEVNEASLVIKIVYGGVAVLFPGDVERFSEEHLLQHRDALNSDLLKAAHHGSRTSSSEEFLRAVTPQWAVISAGRYNRFDHPHMEVLERYERLGIHTLRTDQSGAVIFSTDGTSLRRLD